MLNLHINLKKILPQLKCTDPQKEALQWIQLSLMMADKLLSSFITSFAGLFFSKT